MSWKDNKDLGPWKFKEQDNKFGYVNNPRWTTTAGIGHDPDGYWYKVKPYKLSFSYKDIFEWEDPAPYYVSDDGKVHVVEDYGDTYQGTTTLWISRDFGQNFKRVVFPIGGEVTPNMWAFCMSFDGKYMAAVFGGSGTGTGCIGISSDYGNTWKIVKDGLDVSNNGRYSRGVMSGDGKYIIISGVDTHHQARSDDYGNTWKIEYIDTGYTSQPCVLAMSYSGQIVLYSAYRKVSSIPSTDFYISNAYGIGESVSRVFNSHLDFELDGELKDITADMSNSVNYKFYDNIQELLIIAASRYGFNINYIPGKYITIVTMGGHVFRSEHYGVKGSWTYHRILGQPYYIHHLRVSSDGRVQVLIVHYGTYVSYDYGKPDSWFKMLDTAQTTSFGGMSDDGQVMFVVSSDVSKIYRSFTEGHSWKATGSWCLDITDVDKPPVPIIWKTE